MTLEQASKLKVGDKIRFLTKRELQEKYGDYEDVPGGYNSNMIEDAIDCPIVTIKRISLQGNRYSIVLEESQMTWHYNSFMFAIASSPLQNMKRRLDNATKKI